MFTMKNDTYRKARGGKAFMVDIFCAKCSALVLVYQKDGDGQLKRCYFNRVFSPVKFSQLQHDEAIHQPEQAPSLRCSSCGEIIGMPIRHHDGRFAFRLRQGFFTKKRWPKSRPLTLDALGERGGQ